MCEERARYPSPPLSVRPFHPSATTQYGRLTKRAPLSIGPLHAARFYRDKYFNSGYMQIGVTHIVLGGAVQVVSIKTHVESMPGLSA